MANDETKPAYTTSTPNTEPISQDIWTDTAEGIDAILNDFDEGILDATPTYREFLAGIAKSMRGSTVDLI